MTDTPAFGEVLVVVSIDTEEDNWTPVRHDINLSNIGELPRLQHFLSERGVRPTYFSSYQVLADARAAEVLRNLAASGAAEVAAHLHPWNTPPCSEELSWENSMANNLADSVQRSKLRTLTEQFHQTMGFQPRAFRAGRFGLGAGMIPSLIDFGFEVDSSVMPYADWRPLGGPNFVGAPLAHYRLRERADPRVPQGAGPLLELPITSGFTRRPFPLHSTLHQWLQRAPLSWVRAGAVSSRLGLLRKVLLSPETDTVPDMVALSRRVVEQGVAHLMMLFHSPSLRAGLSPFCGTDAEVEVLYRKIGEYIDEMGRLFDLRFVTASEAGKLLRRTGMGAAAANAPQTPAGTA